MLSLVISWLKEFYVIYIISDTKMIEFNYRIIVILQPANFYTHKAAFFQYEWVSNTKCNIVKTDTLLAESLYYIILNIILLW